MATIKDPWRGSRLPLTLSVTTVLALFIMRLGWGRLPDIDGPDGY